MVDRRKMLDDIEAQRISVTTGKLLKSIDCPVATPTQPVGITVRDKAAFESWLDDIAERMMHNPVAKGGRTDLASLRLVKVKCSYCPG
jgi:hypothetical protein